MEPYIFALKLKRPLLLGLLNGILVTALCFLSIWRLPSMNLLGDANMQSRTARAMNEVRDALQSVGLATGKLPQSLEEIAPALRTKTFYGSRLPILKGDVPMDAWGRAMQYTHQGTTFTLQSLGRDGQLGGKDLDADSRFSATLTGETNQATPPYETPGKSPIPVATLRQYLWELPTTRMVHACFAAGLLASLLTWFLLLRPKAQAQALWQSLAPLLIVLGTSYLFGIIIASLHRPEGH